MTSPLHRADLLRKRAVMRLTLAAMITSAILAPLVLGSVCLALGQMSWDESGSPNAITVEMLAAATLAMAPAACLGGFVMHRGATSRNEGAMLGWGALAGVLFLGACIGCAAIPAMISSDDSRATALDVLMIMLLATTIGSIVSAPMGFAFGLLFLIPLSPLTSRLAHPSTLTPADALCSGAVMLLVASGVALVCASTVQEPVAIFVQEHLALRAPWLALALFPVPLALFACAFELQSLWETHTILRQRSAILSNTHAEYHPGEMEPGEGAIPFTELDRKAPKKRVLLQRSTSAYRGNNAAETSVYVGTA